MIQINPLSASYACMIPWLQSRDPFPPVTSALTEPAGLLAAGKDLSPSSLIEAYRQGIFPWFSAGEPVLWWSPDPRMVLYPPELRISRSLGRTLRRHAYEVRTDTAFPAVIEACARHRHGQRGTWITDSMMDAYCALHERGLAHSVETWIDGELAGGLYGVALGRVFFGESMFARVTDTSKIALVHLVRQLERWQFGLIDCQMHTAHLASLGARDIPRSEFMHRLRELVNCAQGPGAPGCWKFDYDPAQ